MRWLMRTPARWWTFTLVTLLVGGAWTWFTRVPDGLGAARLPSPRVGFPAPNLDLSALDGTRVTLADLRGRAVILNLWASWCGPCRAEMPELQKIHLANRDRGLIIVAVNSTFQDSLPDAQAFVAELGLTFPILLDTDGSVSRRYLLRALPSTFFIDKHGLIQAVIIGGPMRAATLQTQVEELLAVP